MDSGPVQESTVGHQNDDKKDDDFFLVHESSTPLETSESLVLPKVSSYNCRNLYYQEGVHSNCDPYLILLLSWIGYWSKYETCWLWRPNFWSQCRGYCQPRKARGMLIKTLVLISTLSNKGSGLLFFFKVDTKPVAKSLIGQRKPGAKKSGVSIHFQSL